MEIRNVVREEYLWYDKYNHVMKDEVMKISNCFTRREMLIIQKLFEETLLGLSFEMKKMNTTNYVYIIEDSLVLLVSFVPNFYIQYESAEAYLRELVLEYK